MKTWVTETFNFEAAHRLEGISPANDRIHGHSYEVKVTISGEPCPKRGWLFQLGEFRSAIDPIVNELDHQYLNEVLTSPTTAEMLARHIFEKIAIRRLPRTIKLESVSVGKVGMVAEVRSEC